MIELGVVALVVLIRRAIEGLFIGFGALEIVLNYRYLRRISTLEKAREHYKGLPDTVTDKQVQFKIICMFIFGILFFLVGIYSSFIGWLSDSGTFSVAGAYMIYTLIEALYYFRRRNIFNLVLAILLFIVILIF